MAIFLSLNIIIHKHLKSLKINKSDMNMQKLILNTNITHSLLSIYDSIVFGNMAFLHYITSQLSLFFNTIRIRWFIFSGFNQN